ncbi:hypothetical protein L6164_005117 [Bauhinia variegata]|uniref:Uncharacterized protein n=1 Tax=Bauhinia variegata TaxID=167791 RepID=A0ACB9PSF3_BAUVA|nr:hypothetical protein L6164_005117 [Bauhinia variegata]
MEENPPRVSRNRESHDHEASSRGGGGPTRSGNRRRFAAVDESGDLIECSGKYCRSCTAGLVADCVALCCCPCVVLHCFALAFVKAPRMVGRRCLGLLGKKKKNEGQTQRQKQNDGVLERNTDGNLTKGWVQEGTLEMVSGFVEAEKMASVSGNFEADKVWIELHEIGHLGFGRLSFDSS